MFGLSVLSIAFIFVIALLSRSELRLSGEVLGAGDAGDLKRLFELRDCTRIESVRKTDTERLYVLSCHPHDYLVESVNEGGEWKVQKVEKMRE